MRKEWKAWVDKGMSWVDPRKSRMDGNLGIRKSKFQPNFYKKNVLREVPLDDWSVNVWIDISVCEKKF